ncbi:MAG: SRPBCC domain-containing protein [Pseudomonadota bacterium]
MFATEILIAAPPEAVWQAITTKALVDLYYLAPLVADVTGVGQAMTYGSAEAPMIDGLVTAFAPAERLEHGFVFVENGVAGPASEVAYLLTPHGEGTRLTLEHRGYAPDSQPYADISMGWPIILDGLKSVAESQ